MKKRSRVKARQPKKVSRLEAWSNEQPRGTLPGYRRATKKSIRMYLDADILAWFRVGGPGYQTRINGALRQMMMEEKTKSEG